MDHQPAHLVRGGRHNHEGKRPMPEHSEHTSDMASDMASDTDFLEPSPLTARLHRRLSSSPGVIDIQDILKTYARLTKWASRARLLIDDLLARYSVDDGSAPGNLPLVTEQPWMLNLNTYLTNRNSFSSTANNSYSATTNEFFSQTSSPAASRLVTSDLTSLGPPKGPALGHISRHELGHEVKTEQLGSESFSRASGKFRVSRKPRRAPRETAAAVTRNVRENALGQPRPALTYHSGSSPQPGKAEADATAETKHIKTAPSEITASTIVSAADRQTVSAANRPIAAAVNLPLVTRPSAQSTVQRERIGEARNTSPLVSKDRPAGDRRQSKDWSASVSLAALESTRPEQQPRTVALQSGLPPLGRSTETTKLTLNKNVQVARPADGSRLAILETQVVSEDSQKPHADFFAQRNADQAVGALNRTLVRGAAYRGGTGVPSVNHAQDARVTPTHFLPGPGQTDLVWRRNGIDRTVRELMSAMSDRSSLPAAQRAPAGDSTTQSPQRIQSFERESAGSRNQSPEGVELTAERILRRISRTLLVERDRRGY
jgi:hypothetical protein